MILLKSLRGSLIADWLWIGDVLVVGSGNIGWDQNWNQCDVTVSSMLPVSWDRKSLSLDLPGGCFSPIYNCWNADTGILNTERIKEKWAPLILGKLQSFSQCRMMNVPLHTGDEFGLNLRQNATLSAQEKKTEEENRCPRLPRHTGNPQLKNGKASATTAWNTKSTRTPSLVSPYEKTGDSRFAPNLLPNTGVRAVFFMVTWAVVRKVCAKCINTKDMGSWRKNRFSSSSEPAAACSLEVNLYEETLEWWFFLSFRET